MNFSSLMNFERGEASAAFMEPATGVVAGKPFDLLRADKPGPHKEQKSQVSGAAEQIGIAIRTAFANHEKSICDNGMADKQTGRSATVISPLDFLLPGFAMTALGAYAYSMADRRSRQETPDAGASAPPEAWRQIQWNRPGYHVKTLPQDNKDDRRLTPEELEDLLRPPESRPALKTLLGQQAHVREAQNQLGRREDKGLALNRETLGAALEQDQTGWAWRDHAPIPYYI